MARCERMFQQMPDDFPLDDVAISGEHRDFRIHGVAEAELPTREDWR